MYCYSNTCGIIVLPDSHSDRPLVFRVAVTMCGSSAFVSASQCPGIHCPCTPGHEKGATMIDVGMGYVGAKTNPGRDTNIVFDGLHGVGPTGALLNAHGLDNASGCPG